ncbi:hypothetical protein DFP98_11020 [Cohnella phaseoli]|uniref:Uncharacterized protein n=1 Tax=Cohnella phaseoli TaxID=456490 RepID=A0A3D9JRQ3_9BACL|nr:hypothetical protein DFP98_11020 [Cohnella phaseoli]
MRDNRYQQRKKVTNDDCPAFQGSLRAHVKETYGLMIIVGTGKVQ